MCRTRRVQSLVCGGPVGIWTGKDLERERLVEVRVRHDMSVCRVGSTGMSSPKPLTSELDVDGRDKWMGPCLTIISLLFVTLSLCLVVSWELLTQKLDIL